MKFKQFQDNFIYYNIIQYANHQPNLQNKESKTK